MAAIPFLDPSQISVISTFFLVFAVVFGLLTVSKMKFDKRVNAIVALAIAVFASIYEPLVAGLQQFMPIVVVLLIILFFIVFVKRIFQDDDKKKMDTFPIIIVLGVLLLVMAITADRIGMFLPSGIDATSVQWGIGIIIAILFFWAVYKYSGPPA